MCSSHPCHLKCIYLELDQAKYHDVQCYTKGFDDYFILEYFTKHDIDDEQSYQIEQDDRLNQDYQIKFDLIELSNKEFHYAEFLIIKHLLEQAFFEYHFLKQDHFEQVFFEYHSLKQDHRLEYIERNFLLHVEDYDIEYGVVDHIFLEDDYIKHIVFQQLDAKDYQHDSEHDRYLESDFFNYYAIHIKQDNLNSNHSKFEFSIHIEDNVEYHFEDH
ncbi:hypothetical protein D6D28_06634 [Aureobasidium pullulans]|uniref:Uncharacterized protein n=1 Tax=Aureobasidium pullulans TaxID=5580 RepID=A0A4V4HZE5_AURPU|nr:hypothetical protein D6D28_06634 [Aureobasidium pullulans]